MSDDQNAPDQGAVFIHGAASVGQKIISEAESGQMPPAQAHKTVTAILSHIQSQAAPDAGMPELAILCPQCKTNYQNCLASGGNPTTCLTTYENCMRGCTN